jgi:hypothetical protein
VKARSLALAATSLLVACSSGSSPSPAGSDGGGSGSSSSGGATGSSSGSSSSGGATGSSSGSSSGGATGSSSGSSSSGGATGSSSGSSSSGGATGGTVLFNCNDLEDNCCLEITGTAYTQSSANTLCKSTGGSDDAVAGNTPCQTAALVGTCAFPGAGANMGFTAFYYSSSLTPDGDNPYTTTTAMSACTSPATASFIPVSQTGGAGTFTSN